MELPTELWQIILQTHDLDSYKSCLRVNKTFYKIIKRFLGDIPDKIEIKFYSTTDKLICDNCDVKFIHHRCNPINKTNPKELWFDSRDFNKKEKNKTVIHCDGYQNKIIIWKHDVLLSRQIYIKSMLTRFPLPSNLILSNKGNIINMKYRVTQLDGCVNYWFCYY